MTNQETYITSAVRRYKNELITWGCIALFGMLPITFYHIIIG
ncbi:MAG: hypothetical protein P8P27_03565 [Flavobacteriaceae bacterium]|jgi:hypothetical protein|nr:hypothetical protein [Flavobacteriaceae bacterium]